MDVGRGVGEWLGDHKIVISQGVALVVAVAALMLSVIDQSHAINKSAENTCTFVVGIIHSFHTPQGKAASQRIIADYPILKNCSGYADKIAPSFP